MWERTEMATGKGCTINAREQCGLSRPALREPWDAQTRIDVLKTDPLPIHGNGFVGPLLPIREQRESRKLISCERILACRFPQTDTVDKQK